MTSLSPDAVHLLKWLSEEDFNQYGECHGPALDELLKKGLAQIHGAGEHQSGFLAQDREGRRGMMYRAVSLTEEGWKLNNQSKVGSRFVPPLGD